MGTLTDGFQIMLAEIIGTGLLIILGDGVVAGVLLTRSKAQNAGWIVITTGWALGVAVGVYAIGTLTAAHLNPAVTIGLASIGAVPWDLVPWYIGGEMIGGDLAILGESRVGRDRLDPQQGKKPFETIVEIGIDAVEYYCTPAGLEAGDAINPARDLGPRIAHALLPIPGKGDSDWAYSWVPVVGPIVGGILGAVAYQAIFMNYLLA